MLVHPCANPIALAVCPNRTYAVVTLAVRAQEYATRVASAEERDVARVSEMRKKRNYADFWVREHEGALWGWDRALSVCGGWQRLAFFCFAVSFVCDMPAKQAGPADDSRLCCRRRCNQYRRCCSCCCCSG